jgi:uncharacterized protein YihD (DUF1040 family)
MDVKKFQDSRTEKLKAFQKQYEFLKKEYASALNSAINEPEPAQQQTLIQRVQQVNSNLASELHQILDSLNKGESGFEPKKLDDLTNDLIAYQKEYAEIEKSKDKVTTLKLIQGTTSKNLESATIMYYIYIAILIIVSFYVCYLILSTSWKQTFRVIQRQVLLQ